MNTVQITLSLQEILAPVAVGMWLAVAITAWRFFGPGRFGQPRKRKRSTAQR